MRTASLTARFGTRRKARSGLFIFHYSFFIKKEPPAPVNDNKDAGGTNLIEMV